MVPSLLPVVIAVMDLLRACTNTMLKVKYDRFNGSVPYFINAEQDKMTKLTRQAEKLAVTIAQNLFKN